MVKIQEIPLNQIRRPLPRQTDPQKVEYLMKSIELEGFDNCPIKSRHFST